ncbi:phospholipase/Carboxylesterase superfamily protein [Xylogone sp. PMI_703]|nr:phospholipase/Carboxylesterase superfamily protein [Xylogone sp. PMI_703]
MAPRLPQKSDFPSSLTLSITPPPKSQQPVNILLLLHGLGDTEAPFTKLGTSLVLPYTACIALRAPNPIPPIFTGSDQPCFHWGDDVLVDERLGEIDPDAGFKTSIDVVLEKVIKEALLSRCGFTSRDVVLYGFGQGGMVALGVALEAAKQGMELGGVVSVGGKVPSSIALDQKGGGKSRTPVLVLGGSRSRQVTRSVVDRVREVFGDCEYVKWEKAEDSMPASREEMMPIMRFFARRLRSLAGVPEGAMEIGR